MGAAEFFIAGANQKWVEPLLKKFGSFLKSHTYSWSMIQQSHCRARCMHGNLWYLFTFAVNLELLKYEDFFVVCF